MTTTRRPPSYLKLSDLPDRPADDAVAQRSACSRCAKARRKASRSVGKSGSQAATTAANWRSVKASGCGRAIGIPPLKSWISRRMLYRRQSLQLWHPIEVREGFLQNIHDIKAIYRPSRFVRSDTGPSLQLM